MSPSDEHPDGPDPIRDMVWDEAMSGLTPAQEAMALEAELAFDRPTPRFGEITTDTKLDNVVARNDRSKLATDAGESTPASASSRHRLPPVHPDAMLIPRISPRSSSQPNDPE